jgi:hypothetical protein
MFNVLRTALLTGCAVTLAACATGPADQSPPEAYSDDPRLGERVDRICFGRSINGFGETTSRTIVLNAGVNEHYLVETFGACQDLDWAQSVSFDQFSSCLSESDSIIPYDSAFGPRETDFPPQRCRIKAIYEWDPDAGEDDAAADENAR